MNIKELLGIKPKPSVIFERVHPVDQGDLPLGYFNVEANGRKTLGFRCANFYCYECRTPVNDGRTQVHLADFLKERGFTVQDQLPLVKLTYTYQKDSAVHEYKGVNLMTTDDAFNEFDGEVKYDGTQDKTRDRAFSNERADPGYTGLF